MNEEQLKGGATAMFGDGTQLAPQAVQLTDEEYAILEERQAQRRTFLTGRRRKDETREPATKDDMRTSMLVNKHQYAIVREIALREGMTIKDLVSAIFQLGIDRYEEKHGKVEVRKPASGKRDLF
jgi:predicted DNA-binding ribbon-helix-helix protein